MRFREVEIPARMIDAARDGKLVLFVGAGASVSDPSNLPTFQALVAAIAKEAGLDELTDYERHHLDVYLGNLARPPRRGSPGKGIDVHALVAKAINKPGSQPNPLHEAIIGVAAAYPNPKIVTTNYDLHLGTAAAAASLDLPTYRGPALPLGNNFEGLIHLHGALSGDAKELIVTDGDFGAAYLRDAWAARFLERMFATYVVAFIGYSHGDVVMQYLARSLGPDGDRFVFTENPDDPAWDQYGLTVIAYPNEDGSHAALPEALARWAYVASMGHLEHAKYVAKLVASDPSGIPEEDSYLVATIEDETRVRYFVENARGLEWFRWAETTDAFAKIFDAAKAGDRVTQELIWWFTEHHLLSEDSDSTLLRAVRDKPWPPALWYGIVRAITRGESELDDRAARWLALALQKAPAESSDTLDMLLASSKKWGDNLDLLLTVFEHRTRPMLKRAIDWDRNHVRFDVEPVGAELWLTQAWNEVIKPRLHDNLGAILRTATAQLDALLRAHRVALGANSFDSLNFGRSAIEPHGQDHIRDSADVLIDAVRDTIAEALITAPPVALSYIDASVGSQYPILRRLAIDAYRKRADRSADEKLDWIDEHNLLWDFDALHEVFILIAEAVKTATDERVDRLVEHALAGPSDIVEEPYREHRIYRTLDWLSRQLPDAATVVDAFGTYQAAHPQWTRLEHPDFTSYMTGGAVSTAVLMTTADLHAAIADNPQAAVLELRNLATEAAQSGAFSDYSLSSAVQAVVATYPDDGLLIAKAVDLEDAETLNSIIRGWQAADLAGEQPDSIISCLASLPIGSIRLEAARLLSNLGRNENHVAWHEVSGARQLAETLWPTTDAAATFSDDQLASETYNHPAGLLAMFWLSALQADWKAAGDDWSGLSSDLQARLDQMIGDPTHNGDVATAILGGRLRFLFAADPAWTASSLLPTFDHNHAHSEAAWHGFLTWGFPDSSLLNAGLLGHYLSRCSQTDDLPEQLRHRLARHLAWTAALADIDAGAFLARFVGCAGEELRVAWADDISNILHEVGPDGAHTQWERWIRVYWTDRTAASPRPLTLGEGSAMARWLIWLPQDRIAAAELLGNSPAALGEHSQFLHDLVDAGVAGEESMWVTVVGHLLKATQPPNWALEHYLPQIVRQLKLGDPTVDLAEVANEAVRLGLMEAASW